MGKKLKNAILILMGSLGNYAFPGGKPDLDFDGDSTISYSVTYPSDTRVTHGSAPATVNLGDSLEVQLGTNDNLYVIDDANVVVSMGGNEVAGAYNPTTGKVTIGTVTGNVVIVATAVSYVSDGLVLHLDGKNRGGTTGQWKSLVDYNGSRITFALTGCTENSDNVQFLGSSKGVSSNSLTTKFNAGTIEALYDITGSGFPTSAPQTILCNNTQEGIGLGLVKNNDQPSGFINHAFADSGGNLPEFSAFIGAGAVSASKAHVSLLQEDGKGQLRYNGVAASAVTLNYKYCQGIDAQTTLAIGYRHRSSGDDYLTGKIFFIRVYSRHLTDAERARNYKIDKQYYGLT